MHKHVFTLGLMLTLIYTATAIAADDWPTPATELAKGVWTNSEKTTPATLHCADCCKQVCWLPTGTYYDERGSFQEHCNEEYMQQKKPTCEKGAEYEIWGENHYCSPASCFPGYYYDSIIHSCLTCNRGVYCPDDKQMKACNNKPDHASYTDEIATNSDCPWECDEGYQKDATGAACSKNEYIVKFDANTNDGTDTIDLTFTHGNTQQLPFCNKIFTKFGSKCVGWGIKTQSGEIEQLYAAEIPAFLTISKAKCEDGIFTVNWGNTTKDIYGANCVNNSFTLYAIWECSDGYEVSKTDPTQCIIEAEYDQQCDSGTYDIGLTDPQCVNPKQGGEKISKIDRSLETYTVQFGWGDFQGKSTCSAFSNEVCYIDSEYKIPLCPEYGDDDEEVYCWCKMINPSESEWIYLTKVTDVESYLECGPKCAEKCANAVFEDPTMRTEMYTHLKPTEK